MGHRFLRQRPIDQYVVDFFCKDLKLIIEVDGYSHQLEEVASKDEIRERRLRDLGYSILRFNDDEVISDLNNVARTLELFVLAHNEKHHPPTPSRAS